MSASRGSVDLAEIVTRAVEAFRQIAPALAAAGEALSGMRPGGGGDSEGETPGHHEHERAGLQP